MDGTIWISGITLLVEEKLFIPVKWGIVQLEFLPYESTKFPQNSKVIIINTVRETAKRNKTVEYRPVIVGQHFVACRL